MTPSQFNREVTVAARSGSLASFFIARPIFAIVLAIAVSLAGVMGIRSLSIGQYPNIAPTTVRVNASYPGATAEAVENSVTTEIESVMTSLEGLLYMEASSGTGSGSVTLTFGNSVDPDIAQVEVQNRVSRVLRRLPASVQQEGVRVNRSTSSTLMIGNIVSTDSRYNTFQLSDIMSTSIEERIERVQGVGGLQVFGSGYAIRIWLDPLALQQFQLTPSDVIAAIRAQNVQVAAGAIGTTPVVPGQQLRANVTAQSQLQTVEEFSAIILKFEADGSTVRLDDVARVELGLESYGRTSTFNGLPAAGFGVQLASGANALATAEAVHAEFDSLANTLPAGVKIAYSYETTPFVKLSIEKVVVTLIEAIALVFGVLFLFLQNFRATLIPMIAVPVVLLGTFGMLAVLGFSINMLTMFAMVLAIGLLVDDAIVVVENVERIMTTEGLSARAATEKSMGEITSALIGIALVLTAVFIPMAFFAGSVGVIYRQFSVTIATAMILSVLVAIILTPALCAMLLKSGDGYAKRMRGFVWFNRSFARVTSAYVRSVGYLALRPGRVALAFIAFVAAAYSIYKVLPESFIPAEDQGVLITQISLPSGANAARTQAVIDLVEEYYLTQETDTVETIFMNLGFSNGGGGESYAQGYIRLKDFAERTEERQSAAAVAERATAYFSQIRDADIFVLAPPPIQGLGDADGFSLYLEDTGNRGRDALMAASNQFATEAEASPNIENVRGNTRTLESQLEIVIDHEKAGALGVDLGAANALIGIVFGGSYVNDFLHEGEIKPVYVQGDAPYRMQPDDIYNWYARNLAGEMVPYSAFATTRWKQAPPSLARYNGTAAIRMRGSASGDASSGTVMDEAAALIKELPGGYASSWSDLSYQEQLAGSQATILYSISALVIFLCLAALYESWSVPFSVMLAIPIGIFGALLATWLFDQSNDVYFKVGILTTMGLTAKNAILIVEFAKELREQGRSAIEAVMEAARLRLRPIVMTSLAFSLGVLPLAIASGAGSGAQNAIGISVLGGMIAATVLGIFFVPSFFVMITRRNDVHAEQAPAPSPLRTDGV
jgi:multidrug efflux pump